MKRIKTYSLEELPATLNHDGHTLRLHSSRSDYKDMNTERAARDLAEAGNVVAIVKIKLHKNLKGKRDLHGKPYQPSEWIFSCAKDDKLSITRVTQSGVWDRNIKCGAVYVNIFKDEKRTDQICVAAKHTSGIGPFFTEHGDKDAKITFSFASGLTSFYGSIRKLEAMCYAMQHIAGYVKDHSIEVNKQEIINLINAYNEK